MIRNGTRRMTLWWGFALAVLVVVALGGTTVLLLRPSHVLVQVAVARRADLLAQVQCDGILEAPPEGELRASEPGLVAELPVSNGTNVRIGEILLRLANPALAAQQRHAEAELARLQGETAAAAAARQQATADAQHLREVVAGDRRLLDGGAIPRSQLDDDELASRNAAARERAATERLAALRGPSGQLELARAAAAATERQAAALTLHSPRDGTVYGLPARVGETVREGQLVASVVDPEHPRVRLRVDQPDVPRVAAGQRLAVTFAGMPGRQWTGQVTRVTPVLRRTDGREVGEVVGEISDPARLLPLNASVDAVIVLAQAANVLSVPRAALYREGDRRFVYVLRRGHVHRREVTVGLVGLNEVEITGGLAAGERVAIAGETPLVEGLRVATTD